MVVICLSTAGMFREFTSSVYFFCQEEISAICLRMQCFPYSLHIIQTTHPPSHSIHPTTVKVRERGGKEKKPCVYLTVCLNRVHAAVGLEGTLTNAGRNGSVYTVFPVNN